MDWDEKFDAIERAALLYGDHMLTLEEFTTIKKQILEFNKSDETIIDEYEQSKALQVDPYPTSACTNAVTVEGPNFLKSEDWIRKTGTGKTQPSNLGPIGVVEKDSLLDGEMVNRPVKRFSNDFERINVGDSPSADYY